MWPIWIGTRCVTNETPGQASRSGLPERRARVDVVAGRKAIDLATVETTTGWMDQKFVQTHSVFRSFVALLLALLAIWNSCLFQPYLFAALSYSWLR